MDLTRDEELLLSEGTPAERMSMKILATLGSVYGADRLIPITGAHISGASPKTLGDAGVEFLERRLDVGERVTERGCCRHEDRPFETVTSWASSRTATEGHDEDHGETGQDEEPPALR